MTYRELIGCGEELLKKAGKAEYKNDAFLLFEHVFCMSRTEYYMNADKSICGDSDAADYIKLIKRRAMNVPLQYITGTQEFMGFEFEVNQNVLIPRQDTEIVVETAVNLLKKAEHTGRQVKVLDVCTGSGCIAVSIAALVGNAHVCGTDISEAALAVAERNAIKNKVKVNFIKSNLFENIKIEDVEDGYDMIISNPPYIPTGVIDSLMPEVRDYEPRIALDGADDGLFFYREITLRAKDRLKPGGILIYDTGHDQAESVSVILAGCGYDDISVIKDLAGNDRCIVSYMKKII